MTIDLQTRWVAPFNALRKRLSDHLGSTANETQLPPSLAVIATNGSFGSLVTPALAADALRVLCDLGYGLKQPTLNPEVGSILTPLVNALLKQLPGARNSDYVIQLFRIDPDPFGYECGHTKWAGARLCANVAASTKDETFTQAYLDLFSTLLDLFPAGPRSEIFAQISGICCVKQSERPLESAEGLREVVINSVGMRLVLIPAGAFVMGASSGDDDADLTEEFPHDVRITKPFYLGAFQVTQQQYEHVMGENPSMFPGRFRPVEHLRWQDAVEFCRRLSDLPAEQEARREYRLPTEAEWEYACRAGTTTRFWTGDTIHASQACITSKKLLDGLSKPTMPVGSYPASPWGLHDMHGNVWEWCSDWFCREYYSCSPIDDPRGPDTGTHHVLRGGSASLVHGDCRSSSRGEAYLDGPSYDLKNAIAWYGDLGLRVVCSAVAGVGV